jgi:hypothetical protein
MFSMDAVLCASLHPLMAAALPYFHRPDARVWPCHSTNVTHQCATDVILQSMLHEKAERQESDT